MSFRSTTLLFLLLFTGALLASNPDTGPKAASNTCAEPADAVPAFKKAVADQVFNALKKAVGLSPSDPPSFELVSALPGNFSSAMILYKEQKIFLEEAAYDLCTKTFAADSLDALASYLAHEIAHFRSNHSVKSHYTKEFKEDIYDIEGDKLSQALKTLPQSTKNEVILLMFNSMTATTESEADLDGGFLAYLAGFKTTGIQEKILRKTYSVFKINPNPENGNYPSLEERININKRTEKELATLINLFETGNLLTAVGQYKEAIFCYQEVLKKFQSREIYNNLGVLYSLAFLDKVDPSKVKYAFPIELDIKSRLDATKNIEQHNLAELLDAAMEHFQFAINKDPDYAIGHLNLANAHSLKAIFTKDDLIKEQQLALAEAFALSTLVLAHQGKASKKTKADIEITRGIIKAIQSDKASAESFFNAAMQIIPDYQLAKSNLDFLAGKSPIKSITINLAANNSERIENQSLATIKSSVIFEKKSSDEKQHTRIYKGEKGSSTLEHSKVLTYRYNEQSGGLKIQRILSFHLTNPDAPSSIATEKGIRLGDQRSSIVAAEAYGEEYKEIQLGDGTWLIYPQHKLIFELDDSQRLRRWSVYNLQL